MANKKRVAEDNRGARDEKAQTRDDKPQVQITPTVPRPPILPLLLFLTTLQHHQISDSEGWSKGGQQQHTNLHIYESPMKIYRILVGASKAPLKGYPESGGIKDLLLESGILSLGIRNPAQEIHNFPNDWNLEFQFH